MAPDTGVLLGLGIINPAMRVAGLTQRSMRTPSPDQVAEVIGILNRMVGNWNIRELLIYSTVIADYPLTGAKTYTLGPSGQFDARRPSHILWANIIIPGSPDSRYPVDLLTDLEWSAIGTQDVSGTIPGAIYNDKAHPLSTIYLYGQAVSGYRLELGTWEAVSKFATIGDSVILPPGYELAMVYNLARLVAAQFPLEANMSQDSYAIARESLNEVMSINAPAPVMQCDPAMTGFNHQGSGFSHLYIKTGGQ